MKKQSIKKRKLKAISNSKKSDFLEKRDENSKIIHVNFNSIEKGTNIATKENNLNSSFSRTMDWKVDLRNRLRNAKSILSKIPDGNKLNKHLVELDSRLENYRIKIAVVGNLKAGKSTLINLLLATDTYQTIVPEGHETVTKIWTKLSAASESKKDKTADLHLLNNRIISVPLDTSIEANISGHKHSIEIDGEEIAIMDIEYIQVFLDHPILNQGYDIIDSPGLGSINASDTKTTTTMLPEADLIIAVSPISSFQNDSWNLLRIQVAHGKVIPVATRIDDRAFFSKSGSERIFDPLEVERTLNSLHDRVSMSLREAMPEGESQGRPLPKIFGISSIWAKEDYEDNKNPRLESGWSNFKHELIDWLGKNKLTAERDALRNAYIDALKLTISSLNRRLKSFKVGQKSNRESILNAKKAVQADLDWMRIQAKQVFDKFDNEVSDGLNSATKTLRGRLAKQVTEEALLNFIKRNFDSEKDAKRLISARIQAELTNILQLKIAADLEDKNGYLVTSAEKAAKNLENLGSELQLRFDRSIDDVEFGVDPDSTDYQGWGAGAVCAGLTSVGLWGAAATAGNLGGYSLIASALGYTGALGISGGAAGVMSLVSTIGGPLVIGVVIVIAIGVLIKWLFGNSWQESMAESLADQINKKEVIDSLLNNYTKVVRKIINKFEANVNKFCETTEGYALSSLDDILKGMDKSQKNINSEIEALEEALNSLEKLNLKDPLLIKERAS